MTKRLEIVIAHYNEDLSWLVPSASEATIYSKGSAPKIAQLPPCIPLPNIGRETHTYLYHIVANYHNLAEKTMFLQGGIYGNGAGDQVDKSEGAIIDEKTGIFGKGDEVAHTTLSLDEMKEKSLEAGKREVTTLAISVAL